MWVKQIQCLEAREVERAAVTVATVGDGLFLISLLGRAGRGTVPKHPSTGKRCPLLSATRSTPGQCQYWSSG